MPSMEIVRVPDPVGDLDARSKVHDLVVDFYRGVAMDDVLGPVFGEAAEVDWAAHIPKLIDYWCRVLLGEPGYDGYILGPHERVHAIEPFTPTMFERWMVLFVSAVDRGWRGPLADEAKVHAGRIASMLSRRLTGDPWPPEE